MGAFSATTAIRQNRQSVSGPSYASWGILRDIYRTRCTQSYAAYHILSNGIQNKRVEQWNKRNNRWATRARFLLYIYCIVYLFI